MPLAAFSVAMMAVLCDEPEALTRLLYEPVQAETRRLERELEQVEAALLRQRYRLGLALPVAPMAGPVRQAGYRPGDIAEGKIERAFLPVLAPVQQGRLSRLLSEQQQVRQRLSEKQAEYRNLLRGEMPPEPGSR